MRLRVHPHAIRRPGLVALLLAWSAAAGCSVFTGSAFHGKGSTAAPSAASPSPTTPEPDLAATHPAVVDRQVVTVRVPAQQEAPPADYIVGPNDVLFVNVFGDPKLSSSVLAGDRALGSRVDGAGTVQLPLVGSVQVAGLTLGQIQQKLQQAYAKYISQPWVVVEIVEPQSQPLYLVGEFNSPGVYYMDRPTNLVQAIALAHGVKPDAHIRGARVLRNDRVLPVDIYRLLHEGAFDQNVWLHPNDTIFVPDSKDQQVFVLGEVARPGAVPMIRGRLTLTEAIALAGGPLKAGTDLKRIGIIRSLSPTRGELIVIDFRRVLEGAAWPFPLMAGDIVYVPRTELGRWNDAIREILPTLQVISAALQPFVQVQFLADGGNN